MATDEVGKMKTRWVMLMGLTLAFSGLAQAAHHEGGKNKPSEMPPQRYEQQREEMTQQREEMREEQREQKSEMHREERKLEGGTQGEDTEQQREMEREQQMEMERQQQMEQMQERDAEPGPQQ